jgi:hypothetical protein
MKKQSLKVRVRNLEKQILDMQAYLGVLRPVFEKQYKKDGWDWEGRRPAKKAR